MGEPMTGEPPTDETSENIPQTIVQAIGTAIGKHDDPLHEKIDAVMLDAVMQALADGVSLDDGPEIVRRKLAARDQLYRDLGLTVPE